MTTDFKAIQAIAQTQLGAHHLSAVIERTDALFRNVEAPQLAGLIEDLLFYVGNPDCAEELDKREFVDLTSRALTLVSMLTNLRNDFTSFTNRAKEVSHE